MTIVRRLAFLVFLSLASWYAQAQPAVNPEGDPDAVPITGLEYLLIGGGAYGVSRLMRGKKDKSPDQ
jgi:hypothetical protein